MQENWSLSKLPPEGHPDVGLFAWELYELSEAEKNRQGLPDRWIENHRLWRGGAVNRGLKTYKNKHAVAANLIFSNVNRTVANLTAKNPTAEVLSLDGQDYQDPETGEEVKDDTDTTMSTMLRGWWNESEQIRSLVDSCLNMEIYGPTIEKAVYNSMTGKSETIAVDPFAFICAPGNFDELNDAPYVGMAFPDRTDAIETMYDLEDGVVEADDVYSLMGEEREDNKPQVVGMLSGASKGGSVYGSKTMHAKTGDQRTGDRALVVELFVRDLSKKTITKDVEDESGEIVQEKEERLKYPGGIRVITVTNQGRLVCFDGPNPNVNPEIPREYQQNTFLYDHFPYWKADSYRDPSSMWGFAAAEQVGDLAEKISELLSRMYRYLARVMLPPLILPQDTGLTERDITNAPGIILKPLTGQAGNGINYLTVPSLPADTIRLYDMLLGMFDRVYQIEDADRGEAPNRIIAASAIAALQERNAVLMRHKIRQVDYLIRQRGRAAISFFQNFGVVSEPVKVGDDLKEIRGVDVINRKFKYVVESGSTVTQTSLQVKEQAMDLAKEGHIDSHALLETLNFPGWKEIVERMAEEGGQLEAAAQIFVEAGVPPEAVQEILNYAMQPQGAPGGEQ